MKEAFIVLDPTEQVDLMPSNIRKLEGINTLVVVCLIIVTCIAGYYAYQYYLAKSETESASEGGNQ